MPRKPRRPSPRQLRMPKRARRSQVTPLAQFPIVGPAFLGLNTELRASEGYDAVEWSVACDNFVLDDLGRPASRKGYVDVTSQPAMPGAQFLAGGHVIGTQITVPAGTNRVLVVFHIAGGAASVPTSMTYGGESLTKAFTNEVEATIGSAQRAVSAWYLLEAGLAAASGTTLNIVGGSGLVDFIAAQNAAQVNPVRGMSADTFQVTTNPNPVMAGSFPCDVGSAGEDVEGSFVGSDLVLMHIDGVGSSTGEDTTMTNGVEIGDTDTRSTHYGTFAGIQNGGPTCVYSGADAPASEERWFIFACAVAA